jgi:hypothetical protein
MVCSVYRICSGSGEGRLYNKQVCAAVLAAGVRSNAIWHGGLHCDCLKVL